MLWRILIVLVVAAGVLAGSAYLAYEVFWKPAEMDRIAEEEVEAAAAIPPPPHPSLQLLAEARATLDSGDTETAHARLSALLESYPDGPVISDVRALLGELNARKFFSPGPGPGKTEYTVVSGDALSKIARKLDSNVPLIFRVNNLETINLQIGQILQVPQFDSSIEINRAAGTLTLLEGGRFFKAYPLVGPVPGSGETDARVTGKLAMKDGKQIAFGEKDYAEAEKSILVDPPSYTMRPAPTDGSSAGGIVLAPADADEVFLLVAPGTPITVR